MTRRAIQQGDYARLLRVAMRSQIDPATETAITLRGLERMTKEEGRPYSYEHLRKVLAGDPAQSEDCNEVLCKILKLDTSKMWNIAQAEKALRRFGSMPVRMASPDDSRLREIWPQLSEQEIDRIVKIAEGIVASHETPKNASR